MKTKLYYHAQGNYVTNVYDFQQCSLSLIIKQFSLQNLCPEQFNVEYHFLDKNECASNNGGCAHYCINSYMGHKCYCKHGFILENDGVSCKGNYIQFIIYHLLFKLIKLHAVCKVSQTNFWLSL